MPTNQIPSGFSAEALTNALNLDGLDGVDQLLTPAQVAAIIKLSTKWLANAREGRGQISGPPYIKLGPGKTAPIRYRASSLCDWMASFPTQTHTCHRFYDFLATEEGRWLYLVNDETLQAIEFFEAAREHIVPNHKWRPRWMTAADVKAGRFFKAKDRLLTAAALT